MFALVISRTNVQHHGTNNFDNFVDFYSATVLRVKSYLDNKIELFEYCREAIYHLIQRLSCPDMGSDYECATATEF